MEESDLEKMGFILLEEGIGGAYVNLLSFPKDLHTLVVGEWDSLLLVDPRAQQQVVETARTANDMELIHHPNIPNGPTVNSKLM